MTAFYGRTPAELWHLKISKESQASPIYDKKISGDLSNTAAFFSERYCVNPASSLDLPALKKLAAHVIFMAHELNAPTIEGLEIMTFRYGEDSPVHVDEAEIRKLEEFSRELDQEIRKQLHMQ